MICTRCHGDATTCRLCPADHPADFCPHQLREHETCRHCFGVGEEPFTYEGAAPEIPYAELTPYAPSGAELPADEPFHVPTVRA